MALKFLVIVVLGIAFIIAGLYPQLYLACPTCATCVNTCVWYDLPCQAAFNVCVAGSTVCQISVLPCIINRTMIGYLFLGVGVILVLASVFIRVGRKGVKK